MDTYTKQANKFAAKHNVKLEVLYHDWGKYFPDDKQGRDIYTLRLKRNRKQYTFKFGQSIANAGQEPTMYDVLSCIQKYDVGDFEDFCSEFGYNDIDWAAKNIDSVKSIDEHVKSIWRTYKAVCKEYAAIERLFGDVIEELYEIQ